MKAHTLINITPGKIREVVHRLKHLKGVVRADACWGVPDVFVTIEVENEDELSRLVLLEMQTIEGIEKTDTHIVIPEAWLR